MLPDTFCLLEKASLQSIPGTECLVEQGPEWLRSATGGCSIPEQQWMGRFKCWLSGQASYFSQFDRIQEIESRERDTRPKWRFLNLGVLGCLWSALFQSLPSDTLSRALSSQLSACKRGTCRDKSCVHPQEAEILHCIYIPVHLFCHHWSVLGWPEIAQYHFGDDAYIDCTAMPNVLPV